MSTRAISIFKDPNVAKHLSRLHDKYIVVPVDKAPNNIVFVCKSHYRMLDKGIKYRQFTWQPYIYIYIPRRHFRIRKSWTIIDLFCVPLEFQPKMKNWIFRHSSRHFEFHIRTKNVEFVEDHPMNIHVQFGINHICSF